MKRVFIITLILALALGLAACSPQQAPTASEIADNGTTTQGQDVQTAAPTQNTNTNNNGAVIQSGSSANFELSVTGIRRFDMTDGKEGILLDCTITNKSNQDLIVSSLMCFTATDTSNNEISVASLDDLMNFATQIAQSGKQTLDDTVAPGNTLSGVVYFVAQKGALLNTVTFGTVMGSDKITLQLGGI